MQGFLNDKFPTENRSAPLSTWKNIFFLNQVRPQNTIRKITFKQTSSTPFCSY